MGPRVISIVGLVGAVGLSACGKISFGDPLTPVEDIGIDGGDPVDEGVDVGYPDVDIPDIPDVPDMGPLACIPIVLSDEMPDTWPFPSTEAAYRDVFWNFATTLPLGACTNGTCHGSDEDPIMGTSGTVGNIAGQAAADMYYFLKNEAERPDGALWVHTEAYRGGMGELPYYSRGMDSTESFLLDLIEEAKACQAAKEIEMQLAARPLCDDEPDAGTPDLGAGDAGDMDAADDAGDAGPGDGGPQDAGPVDTGSTMPRDCSCEPPPIMIDTSRCAP